MKRILNILIVIGSIVFYSCEKVIDLNLNTADPKYVIEADLNDLSATQIIKISQTVNFDEPFPSRPVEDATIVVTDVDGNTHNFSSIGNGVYRVTNFNPNKNGSYSLRVNIGSEVFESTTNRVPYVNVDSIGVIKENVFNEDIYSITFKFHDPADVANYYKYNYSVNDQPFVFAGVFSDKFNDGRLVTHEITERDEDKKFVVGDTIVVRRECINKDVYTFWSELQSINPGSAAPANPTSNISNGALGYFSVSSAKIYGIRIQEITE